MVRISSNGDNEGQVNPILEILQQEIERRQPGSLDEANLIASELFQAYNSASQPEMGGISPK